MAILASFQRGYPAIVIKNWKLLLVCFRKNVSLEIIFDDCLLRKQTVLHYKKDDFTKWPYWLFFKGGTPRLWSKIRNYSLVCFGTKISLQIIFDDHLVRKKGLVHYKKPGFTKWPYWLFFKGGTPRLWSKIGNYTLVCFGTKISLEIKFDYRLVRKQATYTITKMILQSGHIGFFQRGNPTILIKTGKLLLGLFWDKNEPRNNIWWSST